MKKAMLFFLIGFASIAINAQSDYNKNRKFSKSTDAWNRAEGEEASEIFYTEQTPVGLMHTYNELIKVLNFYGLTDTDLFKNEVLLPSYINSITDFSKVSNAAYISSAEVNKIWMNETHQISVFFKIIKDSNQLIIIQEKPIKTQ